MKKFEITLKPSILHALIGQKHTKIIDVLDAAWETKHRKSQNSSKFSREAKTLKSLQSAGLARSLGRTWGKSRSASQVGGSSSTGANLVTPAATSSLSKAPKSSRKPVNTSTSVNSNAKFILTSTKPVSWVGTWYDLKTNPRKLWDNKQTTFLQQGRC